MHPKHPDEILREQIEEQGAKLAVLRQAINEGFNSGPAQSFNFEKFISAKDSNNRTS